MRKGKKILAIIMTIISLFLLLMFLYLPTVIIPNYIKIESSQVTYIDCCNMVAHNFMNALNNEVSFITILDELFLFGLQTLIVIFELFIFIRAFVSIFVRNAKCKVIGKVILMIIIHGIYLFLISYDELTFVPNVLVSFLDDFFENLRFLNMNSYFYIMISGNILILIFELFRRINIKTSPDDRRFETIDLIEFYKDK